MKQYKLYLFDLDGTLIDSDRMLVETFKELYSKYRPGYNPDNSHYLQFSGPPIAESLKKEFPNLDQKAILEEYKMRSRKYYDEYVRLFPGAYELLKKLHDEKVAFGVVTNKHRYATCYTYELLGLDKFNIFTICADDVDKLKPHQEGIEKAMQHFGVLKKDEVIYIGDGNCDYLTSVNAGVNFGFVNWSPRKIDGNPKIDLIIKNYTEFAKEIEK